MTYLRQNKGYKEKEKEGGRGNARYYTLLGTNLNQFTLGGPTGRPPAAHPLHRAFNIAFEDASGRCIARKESIYPPMIQRNQVQILLSRLYRIAWLQI